MKHTTELSGWLSAFLVVIILVEFAVLLVLSFSS